MHCHVFDKPASLIVFAFVATIASDKMNIEYISTMSEKQQQIKEGLMGDFIEINRFSLGYVWKAICKPFKIH